MSPFHDRKAWNALPVAEAEALLADLLQSRLAGFELKRVTRFCKFGMETTTMVLDHDGCEFVFVPGDAVTLGLDHWVIDPQSRQGMIEDLGGGDDAALDRWIREHMSPLRYATIGPMIVECAARETSYLAVSLDDQRLRRGNDSSGSLTLIERNLAGDRRGSLPVSLDQDICARDDDFSRNLKMLQDPEGDATEITVFQTYRLTRTPAGIRAFLYKPASCHEELLEEVGNAGFRVPTEDEWEYLCGGGTRSLYPWGDNLDDTKNYGYFNLGFAEACRKHAAELGPSSERAKVVAWLLDHLDDANYMNSDEAGDILETARRDGVFDYSLVGPPPFLETPNHFGVVIANDPYNPEVIMESDYSLKGGDGGGSIC